MGIPAVDTWRQLEPIVDEALELEPSAQPAYLDRACSANTVLRDAAERLLRAAEETSSLLNAPVEHYAGPMLEGLAEAAVALPPGTRVGPYRIERELGRGGMGAVYLAERDDPDLPQRVALKVLRPGLEADPELQRRFASERRILAALEHPNIARLLDGGVLPSGTPWFAMELVDGEPLTGYCDGRGLTIDQRLEFFLQVCDAVRHAHQNLVVHRDLKPSNVLVTPSGQVKLLDFGIAKMIGPEVGGSPVVTRTAVRLLTPEYASPEQIRGGPISTAADGYGLGVILYELLTGLRPLRLGQLPPHEWGRAVLELSPLPPSVGVAGPGEEARAGARATTVERLRRRLRGDLDVIALTALRKEPERRYPSVEQLAGDVRRHLDRLPITARPDTWRYRTAKFVRRHPVGLGLTVVLVLTLTAATATTLVQSARLRARTVQAERERDRGENIQHYLWALLAMGPQYQNTTIRQALDRGVGLLESTFAGQADALADVAQTMGTVYSTMGEQTTARQLFELAVATQRKHDTSSPGLQSSLLGLVPTLYALGDLAGAEAAAREALDLGTRVLGPNHTDVARAAGWLASLLADRGAYREAEAAARTEIEIRRREVGATRPYLGISLNRLAAIRIAAEDLTGVDSLLARARLSVDSFRDANARATSRRLLAAVAQARGDTAASEPLLLDAVEILNASGAVETNLGAVDVQTALGELRLRQGRPREAESILRMAVKTHQVMNAEGRSSAARAKRALGASLTALGRFEEAEGWLRQSYLSYRDRRGDGDRETRAARKALADLYARWGRSDSAAAYAPIAR